MGKQIDKTKDLGYLGLDFQFKLVKALQEDSQFFQDISSIVNQNSFTDPLLRTFVGHLKDYYTQNGTTPSYETLGTIYKSRAKTTTDVEEWDALVKKLKFETSTEGYDVIRETALKFFKQQHYSKLANKIIEMIQSGDLDRCDEVQHLFEEASMIGQEDDLGFGIFDLEEQALANDYTVSIPTGISMLDETLGGGLDKGKLGLIIAPAGFGKALPCDAVVYTPDGRDIMGSLKVGDYVIGSNGAPTMVTGVFPQGRRKIYNVKFSDGTACECDIEHLWTVIDAEAESNGRRYTQQTLTLKEILEKGLKYRNGSRHRFRIPVCEPVEFNKKELPIDPYLLGYFIGDGNFERKEITVGSMDIDEVSDILTKRGHTFSVRKYKNRAPSLVFRQQMKTQLDALYGDEHMLSGNKYIPDIYKYSCKQDRVDILNGLMDSDGTCQKNGTSCFNTKSKRLAEDVREIVLSLGGYCKIREKKAGYWSRKYAEHVDCGIQYELTITLTDPTISIFRMSRKQNRVKYRTKYAKAKYIDSTEIVREDEAVCIKVDAEDELFLTKDFIVTHNTSITTSICSYAATYKCDVNNNEGFKVLQIYFEDDDVDVARKHFAKKLSEGCEERNKIEARQLRRLRFEERVEIAELLSSHKDREILQKNLRLKKFKTGTKTASDIGIFVKRLINSGFKPDMISIDYFECLAPEKGGYSTDTEWTREGVTMRTLENLAHELNCAIWIPTQGTKDSMNSPDVVRMDQASGSAKKVHVAQLILSIARAIDDIDHSRATVSILKNRSGKSGKIFKNVYFNNGTCEISCDDVQVFDSQLAWESDNEREKETLRINTLQALANKKSEATDTDVEGNFVGRYNTKLPPNLDF